jgi:hypothetical protein
MSRCTTLAAALLAAGVLLTVAALAQGGGHWTTGTPMPSSRTEIAVAEVSGKIYVVGGPTPGDSVSAANEIFVP